MAPFNAASLARAFVEARGAAVGLPDYPGTMPATLDEAYEVQLEGIALTNDSVAGWKVGRIAVAAAEAYGAERLVGPIFSGKVRHLGAADGEMPVIPEGFAAAEAEYLLELGPLPSPLPAEWTIAEAWHVVRRIHVGIEIASSPFPGINDHGPAVTVSDFGNNFGLLVGPELHRGGWQRLSAIDVALEIDGSVAGRARAAAAEDGPFGAVRFLLELASRIKLPIREGQWISTGAVTGVHRVSPGQVVMARFDAATVATRIAAAAPETIREEHAHVA